MSENTTEVVILGRNYWGKGGTVAEAKREFRLQGGRLAFGYMVITFGEGSTFLGVDGVTGSVRYEGNEPTSQIVKAV
jgi:hypothetical protein